MITMLCNKIIVRYYNQVVENATDHMRGINKLGDIVHLCDSTILAIDNSIIYPYKINIDCIKDNIDDWADLITKYFILNRPKDNDIKVFAGQVVSYELKDGQYFIGLIYGER